MLCGKVSLDQLAMPFGVQVGGKRQQSYWIFAGHDIYASYITREISLLSLSFFLCKKDFSKISGPAYMWVICTGIVPVPDSVPTSTYSFLPPNFCPKIPLTFISNRIILSAYLQAECLDPNKIQSSHKECLKWCSNYLAQDCQLWGLWIIPPHRKLYFTLTSVWSLFQPISEFLLKGMLPYKYKPQKAKNL